MYEKDRPSIWAFNRLNSLVHLSKLLGLLLSDFVCYYPPHGPHIILLCIFLHSLEDADELRLCFLGEIECKWFMIICVELVPSELPVHWVGGMEASSL